MPPLTRTVSLVSLLTGSLAGAAVSQAPASPLSDSISAYVRAHDFNGTIAVDRGGSSLYLGSFGLAERSFGVPATNDTRYWIASITKVFTSALILTLRDEGKLDLSATIGRYLPAYRGPGKDRVTLHQLLNHTSGLPLYDTTKSYEEAVGRGMPVYQLPHSTDELMDRYVSGALLTAPGTKFNYNNADYLILGKIIEAVTGKGYEQVLAERILTPLGLVNTGMLHQKEVVPRLARTYFRPDATSALINDLPFYPENWWASGGMYSTAGDVLTFFKALYGGRVISKESLALLLTPGLDGYGYGLWSFRWEIGGIKHPAAQRPGSIMGANGVVLAVLDLGVTIVVLSNTNLSEVDRLAEVIGRVVVRP